MRVRGQIEVDRKHGEQLRAASLIELAPDTLAGLEKYLASGLIKGVGPKIAQRIVATFGLDALKVLDEEPAAPRARSRGSATKRRSALAKAWKEQRALRDVMVFLQAHGASRPLAARIVKRYGQAADERRLARALSPRARRARRGLQDRRPHRGHPRRRGRLARAHAGGRPPGRCTTLTDAGHVWTAQEDLVDVAQRTMLGARSATTQDVRARP